MEEPAEQTGHPGADAAPGDAGDVLARILDAEEATVGGGSAAALAGAMAAGLLGMVARLSAGKDLDLGDTRYLAVAAEAVELRDALVAGAAADAEAYRLIKAAYSLPRGDAAAAAARDTAIRDALIGAATVPRDNARRAACVLDLCRELTGRSNESAASDLAVATDLARAGVLGCAGNIDVNVASLEDERAADLLRESDELRSRC